jgi:hypothetical protein
MKTRHSSRNFRSITLAAAVWLGILVFASPNLAIGSPTAEQPSTVRLVVDAKALGEAEATVTATVAEQLRADLESAGYKLDDSIRAQASVRVRMTFFDEAQHDYLIDIDISAGSDISRLETLSCPNCAEQSLFALIHNHHDEIFAGIERALANSHIEPSPNEEAVPGPKLDGPKRMGALGGVGIGVAMLGIGALATGGVELGRGKVFDDVSSGTALERTFIDHRPVGGALLGAGAVVLVAGVTMLVVDLVVRSKKRKQTGFAAPLLGPNIVGLGYTGNF